MVSYHLRYIMNILNNYKKHALLGISLIMPWSYSVGEGYSNYIKLLKDPKIATGLAVGGIVIGSLGYKMYQKLKEHYEPNGTLLHYAVSRNYYELARDILQRNLVPIDAKDKHSITPLHCAAFDGNREMAYLLIINNANINSKAENGYTPLHMAAFKGNGSIVALLIERGADLNAQTDDGRTPLLEAVRGDKPDIVELLVSQGASLNVSTPQGTTALHLAVREGNKKIVELLVKKYEFDINTPDKEGFITLHIAASEGDKELVEFLLDNKALIDCQSKKGVTALMAASFSGHEEVVQTLIIRGADVNLRDIDGYAPIHYGAIPTQPTESHVKIIIVLLRAGANHKFTSLRGETAYDVASHYKIKRVLASPQTYISGDSDAE